MQGVGACVCQLTKVEPLGAKNWRLYHVAAPLLNPFRNDAIPEMPASK